ncbi:MAG TPA: hypothetical protein VMT68_01645 [Caulobacteraceae bacterium]|nr:hypothetical protein [Caulobacteraceae bacterium]
MPVTPAHCGKNQEVHIVGGGQGDAPNPVFAIILALARFIDSLVAADASLRAYAAQPCPADCPKKTPASPDPVYDSPSFTLNFHPAAPAQPAVPAQPARPAAGGRPAVPAQPARPAVPAHAAFWSCVIGLRGTVTFDCDPAVEG